MRGRFKPRRSARTGVKRCVLASLLALSPPAAWSRADQPQWMPREGAISLVPLPLERTEQGGVVKVNPFCKPSPIARVGGLAQNADAVPSADHGMLPPLGAPVRLSSGVQMRLGPDAQSDEPIVGSAATKSAPPAPPRRGPAAGPYRSGVRANPLAVQPNPAPVSSEPGGAEQEGVSFSLSDDDWDANTGQENSKRTASERPARPLPADRAPTLTRMEVSGRIIQVPKPDKVELSSIEPSVRAAKASRALTALDAPVEDARIVNGSRPLVDVARPPLVVDRVSRWTPEQGAAIEMDLDQQQAAASEPETKATQERNRPSPRTVAAEEQQAKDAVDAQPPHTAAAEPPQIEVIGRIELRPTEVRALKLDAPIAKVLSSDPAVCNAIPLGGNQLQVVATGIGTATLTIELADDAGQPRRVGYEFRVGEHRTVTNDSGAEIAQRLSETVGLAFPEAAVTVRYASGRMIAAGTCPDEATARKLVRMVRSACPMAVDDQIRVR